MWHRMLGYGPGLILHRLDLYRAIQDVKLVRGYGTSMQEFPTLPLVNITKRPHAKANSPTLNLACRNNIIRPVRHYWIQPWIRTNESQREPA